MAHCQTHLIVLSCKSINLLFHSYPALKNSELLLKHLARSTYTTVERSTLLILWRHSCLPKKKSAKDFYYKIVSLCYLIRAQCNCSCTYVFFLFVGCCLICISWYCPLVIFLLLFAFEPFKKGGIGRYITDLLLVLLLYVSNFGSLVGNLYKIISHWPFKTSADQQLRKQRQGRKIITAFTRTTHLQKKLF